MRRQVSTALSVIALLAVGTAAAAVNVRILHDAGTKSAQFQMHAMGNVSPLPATGSDTSTSMGSEGPGGPLGQPGNSVSPPDPAGPGGLGSGGGPMGQGEGLHGFGAGDDDRPQLTAAQMMLLRVSAMVRANPVTVRAVVRGTQTNTELLAAVTGAAAAIGTSLHNLAAVDALPPMHGRGHGGPGADRHEGFRTESGTLTYDD